MANIFDLFKQIETKEASSGGAVTHLIVGLGNPGKEYAFTRHNAGFLTLDYLSDILKVSINRSKFKALVAEGTIGDKRVLLMQPQTYMNNSGEAVAEAFNFYKIKPENVIVIFDDISLPVGKMRIRKNGSAGGHNGIKSIIAHLGTQDFPRVKIGVGEKPHKEMDLADWVLSKFPQDEQKVLFEKFGDATEAVKLMVSGKTEEAMNKYN
ncbi:MAG: aminoacyl-tRNA hydrolase [Clostridia bacterium]|nr:aminoacyl-tRNA hydrolase [Clostridia bacterium]